MKIVVLHGSPRRGNTYEATQKVMATMGTQGTVEFREFFLPQDMPEFCRGCVACILFSEKKCPHASYVQPIVTAMDEADGFIFTSPVYVMQLSGGMKVLLDHFAYVYMNHRPRYMRKKALVIATTAGAGIDNCLKYLKQNLTMWGVNKVYTVGIQMMSAGWRDMDPARRSKAEERLARVGHEFYTDLATGRLHKPSLIQVIMFNAGRAICESYENGNADKEYWRQEGWLAPTSRYFVKGATIGLFSGLAGRLSRVVFARMMRPKATKEPIYPVDL